MNIRQREYKPKQIVWLSDCTNKNDLHDKFIPVDNPQTLRLILVALEELGIAWSSGDEIFDVTHKASRINIRDGKITYCTRTCEECKEKYANASYIERFAQEICIAASYKMIRYRKDK